MIAVRFAGDSGDGMQLTGSQFTNTTALSGNDLQHCRIFRRKFEHQPAHWQVYQDFRFSSVVARFTRRATGPTRWWQQPRLSSQLGIMEPGSMIFVDSDAFKKKAPEKVGFEGNPLENDSLASYRLLTTAYDARPWGARRYRAVESREGPL